MKQAFIIVIAGFLAVPAPAQETAAAERAEVVTEAVLPAVQAADAQVAEAEQTPGLQVLDAAGVSLDDFRWVARPLVVFADTPADPRFQEQLDLLLERPEELIARDVVVLTDTDPAARSEVRLKLRPRGFQLTLIDKDGAVNLRKPFPWDVREISRAIDKWPLRQEEIRSEKAAGAALP
jgi:hypothetical protein